jgi:WD40 repeat protein
MPGEVAFWDMTNGKKRKIDLKFDGPGPRPSVRCLAFDPASKSPILAGGGTDGRVRLWDTTTGQALATLVAHAGTPVMAVTFSRDGQYLATGGLKGDVMVWRRQVPAK